MRASYKAICGISRIPVVLLVQTDGYADHHDDLILTLYVLSGNVDLQVYFLGACIRHPLIQFVNLFLFKSGDPPIIGYAHYGISSV